MRTVSSANAAPAVAHVNAKAIAATRLKVLDRLAGIP
jgi:hypothetical protein